MTEEKEGETHPVRTEERGTWRQLHTMALFALTAFSVWMAIRGPQGNLRSSWIMVMLCMVAFVLVAGHGIKGVWRGALIDEWNRISLSRLQMLTWTILILSAVVTILIARAAIDPMTAMELELAPKLWALMGISTVSLVGSPLLKSNKTGNNLAPANVNSLLAAQGADPKTLSCTGQIIKKSSVKSAEWSDLFTGEEVSNFTYLDPAKIQMFFFTVILVLSYGIALGALLTKGTVPNALPPVSDGMVALLGISHGGYLANKTVSTRSD